MAVHRTHQFLPLIASAGLLVLTVAAALNPRGPGHDWDVVIIALAWVAVLSSALAARTHEHRVAIGEPAPGRALPARPDGDPAAPGRLTLGSASDGMTLIRFAQQLHGTLESDRLHQLIARGLSMFLGRREVWVVARFDTRQHIILPHGTTASFPELISDEVRKWMTFPMKVKGQGIGVIGVGLHGGDLSDHEHRLLTVLAELVGQSLATANSFEVIRQTSLVDSLTGCATRVEGLRRFEAELRRADRAQRSLAVLMLDLDHFKSVNDRYGHHTGDAVLSAIGEMLLKTLRASDIRCRWGGEEFLLVLADTTLDRARRACEALRHRIATTPVGTSAHSLQITASIGVTMTRPGEWDIQRLVARADSALYRAKSLGRNRVEFTQDDQAGEDAAPPNPTGPSPPRPVAVESTRWPDRRDPRCPDRRRVPSQGRRRTDPGAAAGEQYRA